MKGLKWYAYIHINGSFHLKRYFSPEDIIEAQISPFVKEVYGPVEADTYEVALLTLKGLAQTR